MRPCGRERRRDPFSIQAATVPCAEESAEAQEGRDTAADGLCICHTAGISLTLVQISAQLGC